MESAAYFIEAGDIRRLLTRIGGKQRILANNQVKHGELATGYRQRLARIGGKQRILANKEKILIKAPAKATGKSKQ